MGLRQRHLLFLLGVATCILFAFADMPLQGQTVQPAVDQPVDELQIEMRPALNPTITLLDGEQPVPGSKDSFDSIVGDLVKANAASANIKISRGNEPDTVDLRLQYGPNLLALIGDAGDKPAPAPSTSPRRILITNVRVVNVDLAGSVPLPVVNISAGPSLRLRDLQVQPPMNIRISRGTRPRTVGVLFTYQLVSPSERRSTLFLVNTAVVRTVPAVAPPGGPGDTGGGGY